MRERARDRGIEMRGGLGYRTEGVWTLKPEAEVCNENPSTNATFMQCMLPLLGATFAGRVPCAFSRDHLSKVEEP